jgi:hypothetical protein
MNGRIRSVNGSTISSMEYNLIDFIFSAEFCDLSLSKDDLFGARRDLGQCK